ncbi:hypothetical protein RJT34_10930 [Clitoria ternatea]|uniref:NB-ARC domain-containing protein n=1 Tax=Clitoria ternatea TaxID=43366 RepID=A0AAN9JLH4_CLITE
MAATTLFVGAVSLQILLLGTGVAKSIKETRKDFESEMEALISSYDYVLKMVQSKDRAEVNDPVWKWLQDVDELIPEKTRLEMKVERKKRFFRRPGVRAKMKALNAKVRYMPLFIPIPPIQVMKSFPVGNFEYFKSTAVAAGQLLEALRDHNTHVIGLYGLRGSGKTALVKAVFGEESNYSEMFDLIVFATVSKNPNIGRIQDEVADCLRLKLEENSEAGRSRRILSSLFTHKRVLVIFDDVRAKLDLEDVDDGNIHESPSGLLRVAREVAIECKGLPGKIKDVGSSLKTKPIEEWEASLDSLRHSTARYQDVSDCNPC